MNSLEFIKMQVDEWPAQHWNTAFLRLDGMLWFFSGTAEFSIDLSEHFAPDYYDGKLWTREDFESFGDGDDSSIEWKDASVCYADGKQWVYFDNYLLTKDKEKLASYEEILQYEDFQLNEIQQGDGILVDEVDDEDEYHNVVDVFKLFGFPSYEDAGFEDTLKSKWLVVDKDSDLTGIDYLTSDCKRMVTYKQLMVIGKLKRMLNERDSKDSCRKLVEKVVGMLDGLAADEKPTPWTPTINSIVDVGDCEGVVKAIDGEQYWVFKETGMYDTYHKDSLKQPVGGDVKAVMEATWFTKAAAETLIDKLDIVGYKIVRKETSE